MYEEFTLLIRVNTEIEARKKLDFLVQSRNTQFKTQNGTEISWVYHKTIDLVPMLEDEIEEITEIYARHFKDFGAYKKIEILAQ